ncbi:hypothetical protein HanRHA438_Chr02g0052471 [Helianthus annuus]|nr:hypothetical protein HanHA300_Chr02g0041791 [Helianthus annuus]KAJ0938682.1 hypothetical protein HanRHA438_Chr02g0052471 [Helianthus annuus]
MPSNSSTSTIILLPKHNILPLHLHLQMIFNKSTITTSCLFFILSCYMWLLSTNMWSVVRAVGVVLIVGLVIVLVRTTIVTWITVLVMLRFAGKRRRVLVVEGRKISGDVAMHLLKVLVKERSIVAVACATFLSSMAMVWVA